MNTSAPDNTKVSDAAVIDLLVLNALSFINSFFKVFNSKHEIKFLKSFMEFTLANYGKSKDKSENSKKINKSIFHDKIYRESIE